MKTLFARFHNVLAWSIFIGCFGQLYLIGLAVFGGTSSNTHAEFGRVLIVASLVMLLAAVASRSSRLTIGLSALMPVLLLMQGVFAYVPNLPPIVRALHALNGLVIMGACYLLANGRARAEVPAQMTALSGQQSGQQSAAN